MLLIKTLCSCCKGTGTIEIRFEDLIEVAMPFIVGHEKLKAIKAIREYTRERGFHFNLKECKNFVEHITEALNSATNYLTENTTD